MGVASQHNIRISQYQDCRILVRYKDYVDVCSKDMPTLAPHLSRHAKGIREEERFWLEESMKSVRGNERVPGHGGTTQIAWIYEISERASETKSWGR